MTRLTWNLRKNTQKSMIGSICLLIRAIWTQVMELRWGTLANRRTLRCSNKTVSKIQHHTTYNHRKLPNSPSKSSTLRHRSSDNRISNQPQILSVISNKAKSHKTIFKANMLEWVLNIVLSSQCITVCISREIT